MKTRTALLDADIVAFKAAAVCEEGFDWNEDGNTVYAVDEKQARDIADRIVKMNCDSVKATRAIICLSDPERNFRKELEPTYKHNRKGARRPELLMYIKRYLAHEYPSYLRPRLEADDVMGILATHSKLLDGEKVIVSEDKDMRTIPGLVYNPDYPDVGLIRISRLDADRFHMWQTITGDTTDGYPGCRGVGPGGKYEDGSFVEGPRSLTFAHDLLSANRRDLWDIVVEAYATKGQTEDDAIHQARLAFILRSYGYNFKTKRVRLWNPIWLT